MFGCVMNEGIELFFSFVPPVDEQLSPYQYFHVVSLGINTLSTHVMIQRYTILYHIPNSMWTTKSISALSEFSLL